MGGKWRPGKLDGFGDEILPSDIETSFHNPQHNEKSPGCLGYIGDYTTQLYGDYNDPWNKDP